MKSIKDARLLVEEIAADNGVFTEEMLARAEREPEYKRWMGIVERLRGVAESATKILSHDLYSKESHFILECIQNADDNRYAENVEPCLKFSIHRSKIALQCNEVGFSDENVRALCSVGKSTKAAAASGRYIGQKGIGFKSVFKVAQEVYIRSPPFSFKFDESKFLGMITPIWVEETPLPEAKDAPQTQVLLLPKTQGPDFFYLFKDFKALRPTLLLFLRQLKKLEISLYVEDVENAIPERKIFSSKFSADGALATLTTLTDTLTFQEKYYLSKHTMVKMPDELLRPGLTTSEVILGFPVDNRGDPMEIDQFVHAFLPIRKFGFKFLIQADFILTSNRQDLAENSVWNTTLLHAIPEVFLRAILHHKEIRNTWVRFLPVDISVEFWKPLEIAIFKLAQSEATIETESGLLKKASTLRFRDVPFVDRNSQPLVGDEDDFISSRYYERDFPALYRLGVKKATWSWFMNAFKKLEDHTIASKTTVWHEDLAQAFSQMPEDLWKLHKDEISTKELIPLVGGAWTSMSRDPTGVVFQAKVKGEAQIPGDVTLKVVEMKASMNVSRKRFLKKLGVKDCDVHTVAKVILTKHRENEAPSLVDSITHIRYLYAAKCPVQITGFGEIWLYDHLGMPAKSRDLYLDDWSVEYGAARLFKKEASKINVKFLHAGYTKNMSENDAHDFGLWLMGLTNITNIPRLTTADGGGFTPEFISVMSRSSADFLNTLKHNWAHYTKLVKGDIKKQLSNQLVTCSTSDGSKLSCALKDCFAPDAELCRISEEICDGAEMAFLNLPKPLTKEWKFLKRFGVGFDESLSFYLWILKQRKFREICTLPIVKALYRHIAEVPGKHKANELLEAFSNTRGIFLPGEKLCSWKKPEKCVYGAPPGFSRLASVKAYFGDDRKIEMLFNDLEIHDATISQVLDDLKMRSEQGCLVEDEVVQTCKYIWNALIKVPNPRPEDFKESQQKNTAAVRHAFQSHPLIPIPSDTGFKTATIAECLWSGPGSMKTKITLRNIYERDLEMEKFAKKLLLIPDASTDDILEELLFLRNLPLQESKDVNALYEYWSLNPPKIPARIAAIRQQFEEHALLLVPGTANSSQWQKPSSCIWSADKTLKTKIGISNFFANSATSASFFREVLNVKDASLEDYIDELQNLRRDDIFDIERTKLLYSKIQQNMAAAKMEIFEATPLILVISQNTRRWVSVRECVWTCSTALQTKESLAGLYPNCKRLFCGRLGVKDATAETLVDELVFVARQTRVITPEILKVIKDLLLGLNSFVKEFKDGSKFEDSAMESLLQDKLWPCTIPNSENIAFLAYRDPFFIADKNNLSKMFSGMVPTLALTAEEVLSTMDLLLCLHMQVKIMSRCISETTNLDGNRNPNRLLTEDLQARADALLRCACHYNSSRPEAEIAHLRAMLTSATVFTGPKIVTEYVLAKTHSYSSDQGYMLLREEGQSLAVYVSGRAAEQEIAWYSTLPQKLTEFMGLSPEKAGLAVVSILNISQLSEMGRLWDELRILDRVEFPTSSSPYPDPLEQFQDGDAGRSVGNDDDSMFVAQDEYRKPKVKEELKVKDEVNENSIFVHKFEHQKPKEKDEASANVYSHPPPVTKPPRVILSYSTPPPSLRPSDDNNKANPAVSQHKSSKKRKAPAYGVNEQPAQRTSDLACGFSGAVKRRLGENLGIDSLSTDSGPQVTIKKEAD